MTIRLNKTTKMRIRKLRLEKISDKDKREGLFKDLNPSLFSQLLSLRRFAAKEKKIISK